jgi:hypothetical protein
LFSYKYISFTYILVVAVVVFFLFSRISVGGNQIGYADDYDYDDDDDNDNDDDDDDDSQDEDGVWIKSSYRLCTI